MYFDINTRETIFRLTSGLSREYKHFNSLGKANINHVIKISSICQNQTKEPKTKFTSGHEISEQGLGVDAKIKARFYSLQDFYFLLKS